MVKYAILMSLSYEIHGYFHVGDTTRLFVYHLLQKNLFRKEQLRQKRVNMRKVILLFIFFVYAFVMFLTYFYISLYTYPTLLYSSF